MSYFTPDTAAFTTDKPITGLDDMTGPAARHGGFLADAADHPAVGRGGGNAAAGRVALALRTHRIDGAESTLPTYVDSGYYLLAPYWTCTTVIRTMRMCSWRPRRHGRSSRPEEQQPLLQCAAEAASWQRAHWQGAEVEQCCVHAQRCCYMALLSEEQTEQFRDAAQPLYEHLSETQKEVVRRVRALDESD